jgi:hypothetical protein
MPSKTLRHQRRPYRLRNRKTRRRHRIRQQGGDGETDDRIAYDWIQSVISEHPDLYSEEFDSARNYNLTQFTTSMPNVKYIPFHMVITTEEDLENKIGLKNVATTLQAVFRYGMEDGISTTNDFHDSIIQEEVNTDFKNSSLTYAKAVEDRLRELKESSQIPLYDDLKKAEYAETSDAGKIAFDFFKEKTNYPFYIWALMASYVGEPDPVLISKEEVDAEIQKLLEVA